MTLFHSFLSASIVEKRQVIPCYKYVPNDTDNSTILLCSYVLSLLGFILYSSIAASLKIE